VRALGFISSFFFFAALFENLEGEILGVGREEGCGVLRYRGAIDSSMWLAENPNPSGRVFELTVTLPAKHFQESRQIDQINRDLVPCIFCDVEGELISHRRCRCRLVAFR
jgi:hypothetical protein